MFPRRGRRHGGFPLLLLLFQVLRAMTGGNELFPVTLALIIGNVAAFVQPSLGGRRPLWNWPRIEDVCISAGDVWYKKQWKRVVLSPFFHLDEWHIYYNMASLLWKGISLERYFGSGYFLYMTTVFSMLTGVVYCGLQFAISEYLGDPSYTWQCAAGFSGVLFAFKVVTTYGMPQHTMYIMGFIPVPSRHAAWAELILISLLVPRASFVGHLAGILVGILYVKGPLKYIMSLPLSAITWPGSNTGRTHSRFYGSGRSGYRTNPSSVHPTSSSRHVEVEHTVDERQDSDSEDEALQAAIQQSLQDDSMQYPNTMGSSSHRVPPPYNPEYSPPVHDEPPVTQPTTTLEDDEVHSEGVCGGQSELERSGLRPRRSQGEGNLNKLRAARLSRFGRTT